MFDQHLSSAAHAHADSPAAPPAPRFWKTFSLIQIADFLKLDQIQALFDGVPLDPYVAAGFRHKSLFRARVDGPDVIVTDHAPLYQPVEFNPVHGGIFRHYPPMDARLAELLRPLVTLFAGCAGLGPRDEVLVQAQRVTARAGQAGLPVVEGWHQDDIKVLGLLLIDRVNVSGGISLLSPDRGQDISFARQLEPGELLLINDPVVWHNTTAIKQIRPTRPGHRDIVIITSPTNRPPIECGTLKGFHTSRAMAPAGEARLRQRDHAGSDQPASQLA
jgi:hypothetical protein